MATNEHIENMLRQLGTTVDEILTRVKNVEHEIDRLRREMKQS